MTEHECTCEPEPETDKQKFDRRIRAIETRSEIRALKATHARRDLVAIVAVALVALALAFGTGFTILLQAQKVGPQRSMTVSGAAVIYPGNDYRAFTVPLKRDTIVKYSVSVTSGEELAELFIFERNAPVVSELRLGSIMKGDFITTSTGEWWFVIDSPYQNRVVSVNYSFTVIV